MKLHAPFTFEATQITFAAVDEIYQFGSSGMDQHPIARVHQVIAAEMGQKAPIQASCYGDSALRPGPVTQVIQHVSGKVVLEANLQHFGDASFAEVIDVPADHLMSRVENGQLFEFPAGPFMHRSIQEPL